MCVACVCVLQMAHRWPWHLPIVAMAATSILYTLSRVVVMVMLAVLVCFPKNKRRAGGTFIPFAQQNAQIIYTFYNKYISKADIKYCKRDDAAFHFCA